MTRFNLSAVCGCAVLVFCATPLSAQERLSIGNIAQQARIAEQRAVGLRVEAARGLADGLSNARPPDAGMLPLRFAEPAQPVQLRGSEIAPVSLSKTLAKLTPIQQLALVKAIDEEIAVLNAELDKRLAIEEKTDDIYKEIADLNKAITDKRQSREMASGRQTPVSNAGAESFAAMSNPYFLMCGDVLWSRRDPLGWGARIAGSKEKIVVSGRSVGMIELDSALIGSGFVVGKSHVMTNLHVARTVADYDAKSRKWTMKPGAKIIFDAEFPLGPEHDCTQPNPRRSYYVNAVYATPKDMQDDIAILLTSNDKDYPPPLAVATRPNASYKSNMLVAVLGYPGPPRDMTVTEQIDFFSGPSTKAPQFVFKRLSGGFVGDEVVTVDGKFVHKANTAGGNSGSPIFDLEDGSVVGIHVEGQDRFDDVLGYNRGLTGERVRALLVRAGLAPQAPCEACLPRPIETPNVARSTVR